MKALSLLFFLLSLNKEINQKIDQFQGIWLNDYLEAKSFKEERQALNGKLIIDKNKSYWEVFSNQMGLYFKNKYSGDTLLLIYDDHDVGVGFINSKLKFPSQGEIFAKLYLRSTNKINIIYNKKSFTYAVRSRINDTNDAKSLIFPETLYLADKTFKQTKE